MEITIFHAGSNIPDVIVMLLPLDLSIVPDLYDRAVTRRQAGLQAFEKLMNLSENGVPGSLTRFVFSVGEPDLREMPHSIKITIIECFRHGHSIPVLD